MASWKTLLGVCRTQLGDKSARRYADRDLIDWFVEAEEQACRYGYLIRSRKTVTISADTFEYDYPSNSVYILRVKWGGNKNTLDHRTTEYMDEAFPGWDDGTQTGNPQRYVTDQATKKFHLHRTPDDDAVAESATLTLTCVMLPSSTPGIDEFRDGTSEPEIEPEHHYELIDYVKYRAHNQDTEPDGGKKAASDLSIFRSNMERAQREYLRQRQGNSTRYPKYF